MGSGVGVGGDLQPLELQESNHQNQPVSILCFPGLGSIGGAQALPLPPKPFLFWMGWGEGRGPALCVVRAGVGVVARISGFLMQALRGWLSGAAC